MERGEFTSRGRYSPDGRTVSTRFDLRVPLHGGGGRVLVLRLLSLLFLLRLLLDGDPLLY